MRKLGGWLMAIFLGLRALALLVPLGATFVLVTALLSGVIESERWRLAAGLVACGGIPLVLHWRLGEFLRTRQRPLNRPGVATFVALFNLVVAATLAFGFADDMGRALRRHGDWFCGESNGFVVRGVRGGVAMASAYLERFDPPRELAPIVIPPDVHEEPMGPWRPGEEPKPQPTIVGWFHPLAGPRRAMPITESRRFGAARPQPRPAECELGHCGVDLGTTRGEPVFAAFDGVVERLERDEEKGANAGRFIRIGHKDGSVVTRYIHLDSIRDDLREGSTVRGGELIGRLGRSGIEHSGAHLHFSVSLREHGRDGGERYIDPEPLLRTWTLPSLPAVAQR